MERHLLTLRQEIKAMKLPLEIVARGTPLPPGALEEIREHASRLDHFYGRITRGRVAVESRKRHPGPPRWALRITLTVPGGSIIVSRQKGERLADALRESFDAATRRLEDYARRQRGFVKTRATKG
jgi:hypothetical protein